MRNFFKKYNYKLYLIAILILAAFLRFYQLGEMPKGVTVDEAAIGYNAYAIFTTRRDEWLNKLPISFRSFGDYKAPLAIYLVSPFVYFFGSTAFAIRLPFTLMSLVAILAFYLLVRELFYQQKNREILALLAAFILTVSPWHIHFSRIGYEAGIALTLSIVCLYLLYLFRRKNELWLLLGAALAAVLGFYTYHSVKLSLPLLLIFWLNQNWSFFKKYFKKFLIASIFAIVLLLPFIYDSFFKEGMARSESILFALNLPASEILLEMGKNTLSYLKIDFLIFGENNQIARHSDGAFGVLDFISFILIVVFILRVILKLLTNKRPILDKISLLAIFWIISALIPAIISEGTSHHVRGFNALPGFILLVTISLEQVLASKHIKKQIFIVVFILIELFTLLLYQRHYYQVYRPKSAHEFIDGYLDVFRYVKNYDKKNLDKIIFTNDYQHAYIYALFVFRVSPMAWQGGIMNIFEFRSKIDDSDLLKTKTMVISSPLDTLSVRQPDQSIYGNDGQVQFNIYLPIEE